MNLDNSEIEFNNGTRLVEKFGRELMQDEISTIGLDESISETPNITDESIANNSNFIVNMFSNAEPPKTYTLKK